MGGIAGIGTGLQNFGRNMLVSDESPNGPEQQAYERSLKQAQDQQQGLTNKAKDFRSNLGNYQQQLGNRAEVGGRNDLAENMATINKNTNARGLLYSGINQGEKAGAVNQFGSNLSKARMDINSKTNEQADQMDQAAITNGIKLQQIADEENMNNYRQALALRNSENEAIGSGFKGAGSLFAL